MWKDFKEISRRFSEEVKNAMYSWIRSQDGGARLTSEVVLQTLYDEFRFLDESKDHEFREKCKERVKIWIKS